jgi:hypothetical protein
MVPAGLFDLTLVGEIGAVMGRRLVRVDQKELSFRPERREVNRRPRRRFVAPGGRTNGREP